MPGPIRLQGPNRPPFGPFRQLLRAGSDVLTILTAWGYEPTNDAVSKLKKPDGYVTEVLSSVGRWVDQQDSAGTKVKRADGYVTEILPSVGRWVDQQDSAGTKLKRPEGFVTEVFDGLRVRVQWVDNPQLDRPYRKRAESYITDVLGLFASVPPDYYYGYGKKGGSYQPVIEKPQEVETDIAFELGIEEDNPEFTIKFGSEPIMVRFKVKEYTIEVQQDVERYKRMWMGLGAALSTVSTGALVFKVVKRMIR